MKKILVVEDETSIAHLIAYNLEQAGYWVETTEDGEQACTRVESFRPDLLTLDLLLPLKSGWQVLACIRRHPGCTHPSGADYCGERSCFSEAATGTETQRRATLSKQAIFSFRTLPAGPPTDPPLLFIS